MKISLNTQIDKFVYRSDLETTIFAYFPSKSLNYTAVNLILPKLSTLTIAKITISTKTDITLQTSVKKLRAITMYSAFTSDCGYENSAILLLGDVYCSKTKCSGKLCMHKNTFQSVGRSDYQTPQCASVCQVRNIPFQDQTISFFCRLVKGFTFLKRLQNQPSCYWRCVLPWQVLFQRREMLISWWLRNNSQIHLWLWNVRSVVVCSQSSFYVTIARKYDKNRQNTLFICQKKMNLVPNKRLLVNASFQSTK